MTRRFYIVNDCDRPHESMIAELLDDGKLWYLDAVKRNLYPGMSAGWATLVQDFGLRLDVRDDVLHGEVTGTPSTACYRDGKARRWQGSDTFEIAITRATAKGAK
jgi:hypothetical protein